MVGAATGVKRMVDAFVVPEMNNAVMRLSSLGGALLLHNQGTGNGAAGVLPGTATAWRCKATCWRPRPGVANVMVVAATRSPRGPSSGQAR